MEIKILCECGVKFKFDVEPRDGRSPGPVHCPSCGKDQTAATDEKIREQLGPAPAEEKKRISISVAGPSSAPSPQAIPAGPHVAIPAVRIPTAGGGGAQVSPKMAVMAVPATTKALSVKPPGEHTEEPAPAASAPPANSEPKAAGSPKMAYMPVPEATKALSVKPPGEAVEEHAAPAQIASTSSAPGSPKMAKMEVPTGGTALSVAGHSKKEEAPAAPQAAPVAAHAPAHPAAGRVAAPAPRPKSGSGAGLGIVGAVVGVIVGAIAWYFIAVNSVAMTLLAVIPGVAAGFLGRLFARRASQTVANAAVVLTLLVTVGMQFIIASAVTESIIADEVSYRYDERMKLAKMAADAKTDDQVKEVMITENPLRFLNPEGITEADVAKYRTAELGALQKFAKGEPSRAKFEQTEREKLVREEGEEYQFRIRWIGLAIWCFAGISAAYKICGGESKGK